MHPDILIADSGSTKTEWALLTEDSDQKIMTQGISPYFLNTAQIELLLRMELLPAIKIPDTIRHVYYYGTGCTAPSTVGIVHRALQSVFPSASIHVDYDLVAAAHALCERTKGIACILGTGSNSCYFDGTSIQRNSPGLGYILGDEGSGAHLGKKLISEYLYGHLDRETETLFEQRFETNKNKLLEEVYSAKLPNRFLASFSAFLNEHRGLAELETILRQGLNDFFRVHVSTYEQHTAVPLHFTGGVAWAYQDVLRNLCTEHDCQPGTIIREPIDGLIRYYRQR